MWRLPEAHTASTGILTATTGILSRITGLSYFRNGSELRKMLPLWRPPEAYTASTGILSRITGLSLSRITGLSSFRNGIESRETLPLWKRNQHYPRYQHYSPASTFATTSSTVEQKHGMAASAADMKPREAIVSKSPRKQS